MSAEKRLRNNIDILDGVIGWGYEMRAGMLRRGGIMRVSIGSDEYGWSDGKGKTFPVALDRAMRQFRKDMIVEADDEEDPVVVLLAGL